MNAGERYEQECKLEHEQEQRKEADRRERTRQAQEAVDAVLQRRDASTGLIYKNHVPPVEVVAQPATAEPYRASAKMPAVPLATEVEIDREGVALAGALKGAASYADVHAGASWKKWVDLAVHYKLYVFREAMVASIGDWRKKLLADINKHVDACGERLRWRPTPRGYEPSSTSKSSSRTNARLDTAQAAEADCAEIANLRAELAQLRDEVTPLNVVSMRGKNHAAA